MVLAERLTRAQCRSRSGVTPSKARAPSNTLEPSQKAWLRGPRIGLLPSNHSPSRKVWVSRPVRHRRSSLCGRSGRESDSRLGQSSKARILGRDLKVPRLNWAVVPAAVSRRGAAGNVPEAADDRMGWLLDNALATMPGPHFLVFYAPRRRDCADRLGGPTFGSTAWTERMARRRRCPTRLDPYELAYLRGGATRVARAGDLSAAQQRSIELSGGGPRTSIGFGAATHIDRAPRLRRRSTGAGRCASLFERRARRCAARSPEHATAMRADGLRAQRLLAAAAKSRARRSLRPWRPAASLVALAGYKIVAAAAARAPNVGFLSSGRGALPRRDRRRHCASPPATSPTTRGRAYLAQIPARLFRQRPSRGRRAASTRRAGARVADGRRCSASPL